MKHILATAAIILLCSASGATQGTSVKPAESKVDYLQRIYFSGKNKADLKVEMQIALQEMQQKAPSTALAQQVTFLIEINERLGDAGDACEVLDLLAAGIFNIDAAEGQRQGVKPPSEKAEKKSVNALESLSKLRATTSGASSSATNLVWKSYLLSGGKYNKFTQGAGKLGNALDGAGDILGQAEELGKTGEAVIGTLKSFGIGKKKDNPCDKVTKKEIQISQRPDATATPSQTETAAAVTKTPDAPPTPPATTAITIPGITSSALRELNDSLLTKEGVLSSEKSYNAKASTITVTHSCKTDSIADWIEDRFGKNYKLLGYEAGKISLECKGKKG